MAAEAHLANLFRYCALFSWKVIHVILREMSLAEHVSADPPCKNAWGTILIIHFLIASAPGKWRRRRELQTIGF